MRVLEDVTAKDRQPGLTPLEAATATSGSQALADAASAGIDASGCAREKVIAATTGAGATRTVTIVGSSATFQIGAVPATWWRRPNIR